MSTNDLIILNKILDQNKESIAPEYSDADYFEFFSAEQILKDFDLSYTEIESGIVGKGGDGGIDSLYLFINGEIVREDTDFKVFKKNISIEFNIIQSKTSSSFSEAPMDKFTAAAEDLFDLSRDLADFETVYNEKLLRIVGYFRNAYEELASRFPNLSFNFYYASMLDDN